MPAVCLCFQVYLPCRLRRYTAFDVHRVHAYADVEADGQRLNEAVQKCYLPAIRLLLALIRRHDGLFRFAISLSGVLMEQFERRHTGVLEAFKALADTGCVEFLNETYYHSPAFLFSRQEFEDQALLHQRKIDSLFGQKARTFAHMEMPYGNNLGMMLEKMGYRAVLAGAGAGIPGEDRPDRVYRPSGCEKISVLFREDRLSHDVAGRFSDRTGPEDLFTAGKYARRLHRIVRDDALVNLFMDFENFRSRHGREKGFSGFFRAFPAALLKDSRFQFQTPAEAAAAHEAEKGRDLPECLSGEGREPALTAWLGNAMQTDALKTLYRMEEGIRHGRNEQLLRDWRILQALDHFFYMCTQRPAGDAWRLHSNPFSSPYDAYINYMNILDDLSERCDHEPLGNRKEA